MSDFDGIYTHCRHCDCELMDQHEFHTGCCHDCDGVHEISWEQWAEDYEDWSHGDNIGSDAFPPSLLIGPKPE